MLIRGQVYVDVIAWRAFRIDGAISPFQAELIALKDAIEAVARLENFKSVRNHEAAREVRRRLV